MRRGPKLFDANRFQPIANAHDMEKRAEQIAAENFLRKTALLVQQANVASKISDAPNAVLFQPFQPKNRPGTVAPQNTPVETPAISPRS